MVDPVDEHPQSNSPQTESGLWLPAHLWEQMRADVQARLPQEACGLVGGLQRRALQVFPTANALHSPMRYHMDPQEQVCIFLDLEKHGWDLLAIYHSHPAGPSQPSPTDLAEAAYPESIHLIWFPQADAWACRGFVIQDGQFIEILIYVVEESPKNG